MLSWVNMKCSYQKGIFSAPPETWLLESGQRPSPAGIPVPPMSQSQQCPSPAHWAGDHSLGSGDATRSPSPPSHSGRGGSPRPRHGHYSWCQGPPSAFRRSHDSTPGMSWGTSGTWLAHCVSLRALSLVLDPPHQDEEQEALPWQPGLWGQPLLPPCPDKHSQVTSRGTTSP